jgi:hypothetical protein
LKKIRCYLDTSVLNFFFAEDDIARRDVTIKFFDQLHTMFDQVYISDEVITEINQAPESIRIQLDGLVNKIEPILLEINTEVEELADRYIKEGIIPEKYRRDAIHLAVAVINEIELVVSWNFSHIVKLKTRIMVNGVNKLLGYHGIEICSPEEVSEL